jgi:spore germination cell wall hydrolase CwlJ-like protein
MRDLILGVVLASTVLLSSLFGFIVGAEFQKSQKVQVQSHVVSVMLIEPPTTKKNQSLPNLFENQEHKMEVEAIDESSELYCMAQNVYFEASNQSRAGMVAVAKVVMNRVKNPGWPDTICDVVKQKMQFSWYWDGVHDRPNKKSRAWKLAVEVATEVMYGKVAIDDNLGGAFHYHADYVNPRWAKKKVMIAKIDDHIFYGR